MSETTYITDAERDGYINAAAPPPGSTIAPDVWADMSLEDRTAVVDGYMDRNNIKLQGEDDEEPTFLGGYVAPRGGGTGYQAGDEYNLFINRSPLWIAALQDRMINAGLISEDGVYRFGQWTSYEAKAMKNVLSLSNETGSQWNNILDDYRRRRAESASGGTGGGLPVKVLENEDELTARLQASLPGLLGGNFLPESDARAIARAYRDYASGKADEAARGGTVEKAMSFNTFVEQQEGIEEGATANRFSLLAGALGQLVR
jgi:hypothetical protein